MDKDKIIGERLAILRKARGLTHADLASVVNEIPQRVLKYETGEAEIPATKLNQLAQFFNVAPAYFQVDDAEEEQVEEKPKTIGAKILELRKARGLTQADLGTFFNISYQAVSKWERDESTPDFTTLSRIAQFFGVPIAYFEDGANDTEEKAENATTAALGLESKKMIGVCKDCGKMLYDGDEALTVPVLVCKSCQAERLAKQKRLADVMARKAEEEKKKAENAKIMRAAAIVRSRNKGFIWGAIIATIVFAFCWIGGWEGGLAGVLIAPWTFVFVTQLFWDGAVADCSLAGGHVIGTPGLIFTFDLDGVIWLIGMKILFAVLRFLIMLITSFFCFFAGFLISPFTFVPALFRVNRGDLVE